MNDYVKPIWILHSVKNNARRGYPVQVTIWHTIHNKYYTWELPDIDNALFWGFAP